MVRSTTVIYVYIVFTFVKTVPEKPPQNLRAWNTSSTSLKVAWEKVPSGYVHGILLGYKLFHKEKRATKFITTVVHQQSEKIEIELKGLQKFTIYTIKVLAFTRIGHGASSDEVSVQTDQDGKRSITVIEQSILQ